MHAVRIPEPLEPEPRFLLWDAQSAVLALSCVFAGALLHHLWMGIASGSLLLVIWNRTKASKHPGWLKHWAYWVGAMGAMKRLPDASRRTFLG